MFRSKIRIHTCQVILLTSLVWFLLDVMLLMFYSDCMRGTGWGCLDDKPQFTDEGFLHAERLEGTISPEKNQRRYHLSELHRWRPAKPVRENKNSPGEMGTAVRIPPEDEAKQQKLFKLNQFNLMASDMISLNRSLKDVRLDGCRSKKLPEYLPHTSIVIVFHNEAWSTLLRTVWSVINRSPKTLLKEIILVDDASEQGNATHHPIQICFMKISFDSSLLHDSRVSKSFLCNIAT